MGDELGSTGQSRWDVARDAIKSAVDSHTTSDPDDVEFGMGFWGGGLSHRVDVQSDAYPPIETELNDTTSPEDDGSSGTHPENALPDMAYQLQNTGDTSRAQVSILITDGEFDDGLEPVIPEACDHKDNAGLVYTVGFGTEADKEANDITASAGGTGACCDGGTSAADCTRDHDNYVELCDLSEDELDDIDDGRDLNCNGSYQVTSGSGLQDAIADISSQLACTVSASDLWDSKWSDPWYDCAPNYSCVKIDGVATAANDDGNVGSTRLYHKNDTDKTASGWWWEWADAETQENIRLSQDACQEIESQSDSSFEVKRACMCGDEPKATNNRSGIMLTDSATGAEYHLRICTVSNPGFCQCSIGQATCNQGSNGCDQFDTVPTNSTDWNANDDWDTCHPQNKSDGNPEINGKGESCNPCGADATQDGVTVTYESGSCTPPCKCNPPKVDQCQDALAGATAYKECSPDDAKGRCDGGTSTCDDDTNTWSGCAADRRAVPEICNGLDDDCDGNVDNIEASWTDPAPKDRWSDWSSDFEDFSDVYQSRACGLMGGCVCSSSPTEGHVGTGSDRETEFRDMVDNTNQTACYCSE